MLTEWQKKVKQEFMTAIETGQRFLRLNTDRAIGKSFVLNEIGFELQALGYKVHIVSMSNQKYYATDYLSCCVSQFRDSFTDIKKCAVLIDDMSESEVQTLREYCRERKIPVVGFLR